MSAIELTRELLERYLRAVAPPDRDISWLHWALEHEFQRGASPTQAIERTLDAGELFSLGLCAAAEHVLDAAGSETRDRGYVVLRIEADELLRAAGIDPERWQAASPSAKCCDGVGYCREHNPGGRL